jgi:hypothetical protein
MNTNGMRIGRRDHDNALHALDRLYADWHRSGGISPSTTDEALAVARALRLDPVTDEAKLDAIWELHCNGATLDKVARLHLEALGMTA